MGFHIHVSICPSKFKHVPGIGQSIFEIQIALGHWQHCEDTGWKQGRKNELSDGHRFLLVYVPRSIQEHAPAPKLSDRLKGPASIGFTVSFRSLSDGRTIFASDVEAMNPGPSPGPPHLNYRVRGSLQAPVYLEPYHLPSRTWNYMRTAGCQLVVQLLSSVLLDDQSIPRQRSVRNHRIRRIHALPDLVALTVGAVFDYGALMSLLALHLPEISPQRATCDVFAFRYLSVYAK
ncbi:hypothetical protein B0H14DRAFT_3780653 [Mycena olivaceomarginata]|nr:hypothetical protein B0H14DRAFT_3780653 [Mycena olivaceomarginata]